MIRHAPARIACICRWKVPPVNISDRDLTSEYLIREAASTNAYFHYGSACIGPLGYMLYRFETSLDQCRNDEDERTILFTHQMLDAGANPNLATRILHIPVVPLYPETPGGFEVRSFGTFTEELARLAWKHPERNLFKDVIQRMYAERGFTRSVRAKGTYDYYVWPFVWTFEEPLYAIRRVLSQHRAGTLDGATVRNVVARTKAYIANAEKAFCSGHMHKTLRSSPRNVLVPTTYEDASDGTYALVLSEDQRCVCGNWNLHGKSRWHCGNDTDACVSSVGLYCRRLSSFLAEDPDNIVEIVHVLHEHIADGDDFVSATFLKRPSVYDTRHRSPLEDLGILAMSMDDPAHIRSVIRAATMRNKKSFEARRNAKYFSNYSLILAPYAEDAFQEAGIAVASVEYCWNSPPRKRYDSTMRALRKAHHALARLQDVYALKIFDSD